MPTLAERLEQWSQPEPNSGCLLWLGAPVRDGYGQLSVNGRLIRAHRLAWEVAHGPVHPNLCVLHSCDTPACINPAHLFVGTRLDNARDRKAKGRNHKTWWRTKEAHK